jgi:hypothetical protein
LKSNIHYMTHKYILEFFPSWPASTSNVLSICEVILAFGMCPQYVTCLNLEMFLICILWISLVLTLSVCYMFSETKVIIVFDVFCNIVRLFALTSYMQHRIN